MAFGLNAVAIAIVSFVVIAGVGALILAEFQATDVVTADSYADNITDEGLEGLDTMADFVPVIVVALIGILILGFFMGGKRQ